MRLSFCLSIAAWFVLHTTNAFNIAVSNSTERYFLRAVDPLAGAGSMQGFDGISFFGYNLRIELQKDAKNRDMIKLTAGAPSEIVQAKTDTTKPQGGVIQEPGPVLRGAVVSTNVMGSLYFCESPLQFLLNSSAPKSFNCSTRAGVDRQLSGNENGKRDALGISLSSFPVAPETTVPNSQQLVTCAHLRQHDCVTTYKAEGACYISESVPGRGDSKFTTVWHKRTPCRDSCFEKPMDLMFVVDGSHSVGNDSFKKIKQWIKDVTEGFEIGSLVQVGVVQYSYLYTDGRKTQKYIKTEISLGEFTTKAAFDAKVDAIQYHGYQTFTAHAINKTVRDDFNGPTSRYPSARRVMILLTDGYADDAADLPGATQYAREQGVESFAVGVGQYSLSQLEAIAGSKEAVITVNNFDDLSKIVAQLQRGIQVMEGSAAPGITNELMQCEAGISSSVQESGSLILGAVGAYDWSGTLAKYDSASDQTADIQDFEQVKAVLPNRTKESYLGYSLTTGFYDGPGVEYAATGAPRYMLEGAVVVYIPLPNNKNFTNSQTIRAYTCGAANCQPDYRQLGSYFGGALLSVDVNNDGKDDLFVGAPLYIGDKFDEGRVFVYMAQGSQSTRAWASSSFKPIELYGDNLQGGRFGTAMASAGDLNQDGYKDVIVGAPMSEGDQGAVFVYHGSSSGIDVMFKQKILASALKTTKLQYFGQSLQGGVDLDGNKYPDVAVGAPKSDTVVIFRSRPVITFTATVSFDVSQVNVLQCFNIDNRQCLTVTTCLTYSGVSVESQTDIIFNVTLDSKKVDSLSKRVEFRTDANSSATGYFVKSGNVTLLKNTKQCWTDNLFVKNNILDYSSPIEATFTYDLTQAHKDTPLSSVRDPFIPNAAKSYTEFSQSCGKDKTCLYNLGINSQLFLPTDITVDGKQPGKDLSMGGQRLIIADVPLQLVMKVNLTNTGENAFGTRLTIAYSPKLSWSNVDNVKSSNSKFMQCISGQLRDGTSGPYSTKTLSYQYSAKLGSIMPENQWCYLEIRFLATGFRTSGEVPDMTISILADTTTNGIANDTDKANNYWNSTRDVRYRSDVEATRTSIDRELSFNTSRGDDTVVSVWEIGNGSADVSVEYEVKGLGYSNIPLSKLTYTFPSKLTENQHLFYLYKVDCTTTSTFRTGCSCNQTLVNPYRLSLMPPNENNTNGPNVTMYENSNGLTQFLFDCSGETPDRTMCQTLECDVRNLGQSDSIIFQASFRLWTKAFNYTNDTQLTFRSGFKFDTSPSTLIINKMGENATIIRQTVEVPVKKFSLRPPIIDQNLLWIYIVAAIAGLLLLIIIVIIMYKTGFFKSKYADMKQEALEWNEVNTNGQDQSPTDQLVN